MKSFCIFLLVAASLFSGRRLCAQGLDGPEPIGTFLNGVFPPQTPGTGPSTWSVTPTFTGLNFTQPMYLAPFPGTNYLLLVEKAGRIWKFNNDPNVTQKTLFLDISAKVFTSSDCALTYFAFHPDFGKAGSPNRGYLYITYKWAPLPYTGDGNEAYWRLSRFTIPDGQTVPDPASELVLIQQFDRQQWHDSGCLLFGPDGYLYIGTGDEGGENDQYMDGQKINDRLFSGILRIDVNQDPTKSHAIRRHPAQIALPAGWPNSFTTGYFIPNDNPFVDPAGGALEEFYALGFRNPYRFNYDTGTGQIWVGDVGQDTREEVDVLLKGANYGWPFREGIIAGPQAAPAVILGTLTDPIWDYAHNDPNGGGCVIGGYFYHGQAFPSLLGKYITVDNVNGRISALTPNSSGPPTVQYLTSMPSGSVYSGTSSCGIDANGELYFLKIDGQPNLFYKLTQTQLIPNPPALLSQTGAFSNLATLTPATGLIPYTVNAPLWSDGAVKQRWLALPNNGGTVTAAQKIQFAADAEWSFPAGTVLIKHFELPVDDSNPAVTKRLETRFFVISSTGEPYGITYQWRADGWDADLLTAGASQSISIRTVGGGVRTQTWSYPSRSDCMICHNVNAGYLLGVKTHQLNGNFTYPKTGRTANQLSTLSAIGYLSGGYHEAQRPYFLQSRNISDTSASLEMRVRSYLDANCSQCHRPNGARADFDARLVTQLADQQLINGPILGHFSNQPESPILPGDLTHSIIYYRADQVGVYQMPPLARNVVDATAMQVLAAWINSLATGPGVQLNAPATVFGPFAVNVTFTQPVTGLDTSGFFVLGGTISSLTGSDANYTLTVAPNGDGDVSVRVLPNAAQNGGGLPNYASAVTHINSIVTATDPTLVAWLRLDEQAGNIAFDSSQNGNHGQIQNGTNASWIPGRFGNALQFSNVGEGISLVNVINATNGLTGDDFTISFWINTLQAFPVTNVGHLGIPIFSADMPGFTNDFMITGTNNGAGINRISFQTGHANGAPDTPIHGYSNISTGQWLHIAIKRVKSTGMMSVYMNGNLENSGIGSVDQLNANDTIVIGTSSPGGSAAGFVGSLDQIRIYNRALSDPEITTLAQDQGAGSTPSPFAQWLASSFPGLLHLQDPLLDPDGDGVSNFAEFAFGGNPLAPDVIPISVNMNANGTFTLTFRAQNAASGVSYTVDISHDLTTWAPAGAEFGNLRFTPISGTSYQWVFGDYTPAANAPLQPTFFRVRAND